MNNLSTILQVENLSLGYRDSSGEKRTVYQPLSLTANDAELIALIGRNGVGKSTLLRSIAGLQKPLGGNIQLLNKPLPSYSRKELATLVSFVASEPVRVSNMKIFDLVSLGRFPYSNWLGGLSNDDKRRVLEAIDMVGLSGFAWRNIDQLSDGERQRAMIARSLAQDTQLIIFDEPTAFIDLPSKYEVMMLLRNLTHERNKTIIFSTHDLTSARRLSDKCWLMSSTGLVSGAPEDLALQNAYNNLFEHTDLRFDSKTGNVSIDIAPCREVYVTGSVDTFWIERAFERFGFKLCSEPSAQGLSIDVSRQNDALLLELTDGEEKYSFTSIYDLGRYFTQRGTITVMSSEVETSAE